jgi:class 3 adenylate cyclase
MPAGRAPAFVEAAPGRFWCTGLRSSGVPMAGLPTGTVTFLFTDLESSSRLWEEHPEAMKAALARHDVILREAVKAHGGCPGALFRVGFFLFAETLRAWVEGGARGHRWSYRPKRCARGGSKSCDQRLEPGWRVVADRATGGSPHE